MKWKTIFPYSIPAIFFHSKILFHTKIFHSIPYKIFSSLFHFMQKIFHFLLKFSFIFHFILPYQGIFKLDAKQCVIFTFAVVNVSTHCETVNYMQCIASGRNIHYDHLITTQLFQRVLFSKYKKPFNSDGVLETGLGSRDCLETHF